MRLYTPEFIIYPLLFMVLLSLGYIMVRLTGTTNPVFSLVAILTITIIFWVVMYVLLTVLLNFNALPCINVVGYAIGGCI